MEILPLPEPDRRGYLITTAQRAVAIDPPLDTDAVTEFIPGWMTVLAVLETGIPAERIAGGRLLAEVLGAPLYGPDDCIAGARPLRESTRVPGFPEVRVVPAPGAHADDIAVAAADTLLVGDLDRGGWSPDPEAPHRTAATRRQLARRFRDARIFGSTGPLAAPRLADLPAPATGPAPLNHEAVDLTNRGKADMFWADPRYGSNAREVGRGYVAARAGSPWAPIILDLRTGGEDIDGARRIPPARLASEMTGLATGKELVVVADRAEVARAAARFLARLGLNAVFVRD